MNARLFLMAFSPSVLLSTTACVPDNSNPAAARQATATRQSMDSADRQIGMPRIANFSQRKLLKNAYEDMDQTVLTYVYTQSMDGLYVCLGQSVGYGVSLGTQFTAPTYPQYIRTPYNDGTDSTAAGAVYEQAQPEPNGLYMPEAGAATIVNLIDAKTGEAHTMLVEPDVITIPFQLPEATVKVKCPTSVDPTKVKDAKEEGSAVYRK